MAAIVMTCPFAVLKCHSSVSDIVYIVNLAPFLCTGTEVTCLLTTVTSGATWRGFHHCLGDLLIAIEWTPKGLEASLDFFIHLGIELVSRSHDDFIFGKS